MKDISEYFNVDTNEPLKCHSCKVTALEESSHVEKDGVNVEWKVRCMKCDTLLGHRTMQNGKVVWDSSYAVGYAFSE